jgi:hypothetical protein
MSRTNPPTASTLLGDGAYLPDGAADLLREQAVHGLEEARRRVSPRLRQAAVEIRVAMLGAQDVLARDDADQLASLEYRHAPDVLPCEHALEVAQLHVGRHGHDVARHEALHRSVREPVPDRLVHVLASHQPEHHAVLHDRQRPMPPAQHEIARLAHALLGRHGPHARRHHVGRCQRRSHLGEQRLT